MSKVTFVIPTAYNRPQYLTLAFASIAEQATSHKVEILVGCPEERIAEVKTALPEGAVVVAEDKAPGLAGKLDKLIRAAAQDSDYVAWLGDDDLLTDGSIDACIKALENNLEASMVYGGCDYIDADGRVLFTNGSGAWASKILTFGPQLIPQPGSIMRSSSYLASGGLSNDFNLAFDFDLFLKLQKTGPIAFIDKTLAQFRWHPTSLSVKKRMTSVMEASKVRRKHYKGLMRLLWPIWEPWVILATWLAGKLVNLRFVGK